MLLLGALSPFAAAPVEAQTEWRGTLAPQNFYSNYYGCGFEDAVAGCQISSNLNPNTFTFNGKQWSVQRLDVQEQTNSQTFTVSFANPQSRRGDADAFSRLKLRIGDFTFDLETGDNAAYRLGLNTDFSVTPTASSITYRINRSKPGLKNLQDSLQTGGAIGIELYGLDASNPPVAPTNLRVVSRNDRKLDFAWTAPSGVVAGYDVHYTSMLNPNLVRDTQLVLNHPIRNNPAVGWVAFPRTGATALQTIPGLAPGTAYRVRVRARNSAGVSDWVVITGTTPSVTVSAPPAAGDVLVSNFSQRPYRQTFSAHERAKGQAFTTGSVPTILSSIDVVASYSAHTHQLQAELWSATSGGFPSAKISDLVVPWGNIAAGATVSFRAPANTRLEANTAYSIVLYKNANSAAISFVNANNHNEDPGTATGWSITDGAANYDGNSPSTTLANSLLASSLVIAVKGTPVPATATLSASPATVQEGSPVTVTATLAYPLSEDVRIPLNTAMVPFNLATVGSYDITIAAGETTGTQELTAPQLDDGEMKQYQIAIDWWRMRKSTPLKPKGSQSYAGVTVLDENADPHRVSVSDASGTEMANGYPRMCFAFTLNRAAAHEIWVNYWTEDGTAVAGQDYLGVEPSNMAIAFKPGETRKRKCFGILDDNVEDSGETFSVVLANPHGAILGRARGTGTIYNHEPTSLSGLTAEGASDEEGPFTALDIGTFAPATTDYAATVPHGTTHVRLTAKALNRYLTITTGLDGKGKTQVPFGTGPAVALAVGENVLVVKTLLYTGQRQTYRVTVTRQEAPAAVAVSLSATPNPVQEGSPVTVRATLAEALDEAVTVPLTVTRGTSEDGDHGSLASIEIPGGGTSATGTITTVEDADGDDETFTVALGSLPSGLAAGSASSVEVTITDSGLQQRTEPLTAAFENVPSEHDGTAFSFDLTLSEAPGAGKQPVAASFKVAPGKASVSGSGRRYTVTVTPKPANAWKDVTITLAGGRACDEAGAVCTADGRALSNTSSVTVGGPVRIRIEGAKAREGKDASLDFAVTLNRAAAHDVSVDYATADETATAGSDYTATSGTLTFAAGETAKTVSVPVLDDAIHEGREVMRLLLSNPQGAYLRKKHRKARGIITNADPLPSAWQIRFGRSVSQQVVDALQQRFSTTTTPSGLQLTLAGEAITGDTPLEENHVLLSRLLGFERVSGQELAQGSSFSFSPDGAGPRLSFWGKGAFSSFDGVEESITLTGEVTTALVGAEWNTQRWQAGAALSHSWGNGSYQGEADGADGRISSSLTGVFPYGRYALTPRLGLWATAGYGWGAITLNPDGDAPEYNPATTLALGAVGMDGLLLDGGREGITLTTTADALFLKTSSEAVEGLASSEGNISRLRLGLEATRPFPLSNGASLSPSLEVGLRQDSGDAETGFGMDLGAGLSWSAPERGITATVKGRTLLSHGAEDFQDQGLALSFSWQPSPSNRGPSLSMSHAVGLSAEGGMAALLNPTAIEVLDDANSSGERFEARLAYGFPFYNNRLTLSPAVALALSNNSRTYGLLWSLSPYDEHLHAEPWELSLEGERQEHLSSSSSVDHSLKLRFALPL